MASSSEYHVCVRYSIPASLIRFSLPALLVLFVSATQAQINGGSGAANSAGFGGHAVTGTVPSVTGPVRPPTGTVPLVNPLGPSIPANTRSHAGSGNGQHHHYHHDAGYPGAIYALPVPYGVGSDATDDATDADDDDPNYQGGPTIFDRRGSGADSYIPPVSDVPAPHAQVANADPPALEPPQAPTLLVFKDGHTIEVSNYAIVGATLFDLTPGHARKVALSDLDLEATTKQNDDRGVTFQLPSSSLPGN